MSRAQAESVIKNIIREIAQECASKGQAVSETLVAFMVSMKLLYQSKDNIITLIFVRHGIGQFCIEPGDD